MIDEGLSYLGDAEHKTTKSTEVQRIPLSKTFVRGGSDEDLETVRLEIKPNSSRLVGHRNVLDSVSFPFVQLTLGIESFLRKQIS